MKISKKSYKLLALILIILFIFFIKDNYNSKYDLNETNYIREGNEINFHIKDYKKMECNSNKDHISFLVFGQSNAGNFIKLNKINNFKNDNLMFFESKCFLLEDKVLGSTGSYSSMWNMFAAKMSKNTENNKKVMIISKAIGGTSISDWSNDRQNIFTFLLDDIENYEKIFGKPIDYIILIIGETDGYIKTTEEDYISDINNVFKNIYLKSKYSKKPKIFMTLTSKCYNNESNFEIINAQRIFSNINENIEIFTFTDNLGSEYRWDNCHYNQIGAEYITNTLVKKIIN